MAPAALATIKAHFADLHTGPEDFDRIVTGDLGAVGKEIPLDQFRRDGVGIGGVYNDCGTMIFDMQKQDVHAGGSGCGCSSFSAIMPSPLRSMASVALVCSLRMCSAT